MKQEHPVTLAARVVVLEAKAKTAAMLLERVDRLETMVDRLSYALAALSPDCTLSTLHRLADRNLMALVATRRIDAMLDLAHGGKGKSAEVA